jgi:predicted nucleotidyltransferase
VIAVLEGNLEHFVDICQKRHVRRLALFGSATGAGFDPVRSDVDLLVDFLPMLPREHADNYFGLLEDLEGLLGLPVDLVEERPVKNPFFIQMVEQTRVLLYAAA